MPITIQRLQEKVELMNTLTESPTERFTEDENGNLLTNIGHFYISQAYGGYMLMRHVEINRGSTAPFGLGHRTKKELNHQINGFLAALEMRPRIKKDFKE